MLDTDAILYHPAALPVLLSAATGAGWALVAAGDWLGRIAWRALVFIIDDARKRQ